MRVRDARVSVLYILAHTIHQVVVPLQSDKPAHQLEPLLYSILILLQIQKVILKYNVIAKGYSIIISAET
jgi:hypothetical protein